MKPLLADKICIVTGAGSGVGAAAASVFSREGATVVLVGRTAATLELTAADIEKAGGRAMTFVADVSRGDDCRRMVEATVSAFGRLDCAFNNAAVDGVQAPTADYPEQVFDEVMAINLKGVWNCMRFQIPEMRKHGRGGAILNVSSATTVPTQPMMSAYVASKYGVNALTKTAALEYAQDKIRVNALLLGVVATPMGEQIFEQFPHYKPALLAEIPLRRFAEPEECGEMAAWLLSDRCSYMYGSEVLYDGGYVLPQRLSS